MAARRFILSFLAICLFLPVAALSQTSDDDGTFYEVEALNPGLGEVPDGIDRETPQSTMESFLFFADNENWEAAAHLLDLTAWPEDEQAELGPKLARELHVVIDRKVVVNWHALPDRPDALNPQAPSESAMAGMPRKSLMIWIIDAGNRPVTINLNRIAVGGENPVWVFGQQSVQNIPQLYDLYGPSKLEQNIPEVLKGEAFWSLRWWEVIILPLAILFSIGVGVMSHRLMSRGMHRTLRDSGSSSFLVAFRAPVILAVVTGVMATLTQNLFVFSGRIDTLISPLVVIGFTVAACWALVNATDVVLDRLIPFDGGQLSTIGDGQERKRALATKIAAVRRAAIVVLVVFGVGLVLQEANLMQTLGFSMVASAGVLTLILAYAARDVLSNIMSSLQIAMNQSARIGDRVVYKDYICAVERINFTYVQLRTWTGKRLVVPVNEFVSETFENWTMQDPFLIREVKLQLAHDADVEVMRKHYNRILDVLQDELGPEEERGVYVTDHDVFSQTVTFLVPCPNPNQAWALSCEVRERLLAAAREVHSESNPIFPQATPAEAA
ncbi:mechanosensitive ion channel family protein [Pelagovum pacificum]|uniref:Mechanosensitive ion channel n=1 Tax=Pelagovum pacificum TaxID=2588711 RepID=A0A5C5GB19_9RHOB|nr:mechanosensitive ion channel domain-containing protein [Pelagovum pacificum]QQA41187.1 mechanosensitive ion channel [Pelagovum pacificum]TNY32005.1 mechanosensitive ion channel [Pelagovum pacificum]